MVLLFLTKPKQAENQMSNIVLQSNVSRETLLQIADASYSIYRLALRLMNHLFQITLLNKLRSACFFNSAHFN
jgi:hypothetical protein